MKRLLRWALVGGKSDPTIPIINVVRMEGVIASSQGARGPQARRIISLDRVEKWLLAAFMPALRTFRPAAVAISLNSPGGSATQSELIHQRIRFLAQETKTPVFTFAEDVAASGAYWLICAGDECYASKTSLVGSIGVITAGFGLVDLSKRLGVERRVYTAGELKDTLDPFRPVKPEEEARLKEMLLDLHESFKETVRAARGNKLDTSNERELWSGRVWTGRQAAKLGLVDGTGTLNGVMRAKYGDKAHFVLCSDLGRPGLLEAIGFRSSGMTGGGLSWPWLRGGPPDVYSVTQSATQALLDEMEFRSMMARYGL